MSRGKLIETSYPELFNELMDEKEKVIWQRVKSIHTENAYKGTIQMSEMSLDDVIDSNPALKSMIVCEKESWTISRLFSRSAAKPSCRVDHPCILCNRK